MKVAPSNEEKSLLVMNK